MAAGSGTGVGGSKFGSRQYPYYSPNDFHHDANNVYSNCAVSNYNDKYNVQYCDLSGLPDLLTSSSYVQSQIVAYLNKLYSYGVKGIRIDAAKHQDATELGGIIKQLPSDFYVISFEAISFYDNLIYDYVRIGRSRGNRSEWWGGAALLLLLLRYVKLPF